MKKYIKVVLSIILIVMFVIMGVTMSNVNAATTGDFYYITTTPGEDTSTEINMNWHTKVSGSVLEYTTVDDTKFEKAIQVTPVEKMWSTAGQANASKTDEFYKKRFVCSVNLTGLTPRTKYMYRISAEGNHSDVHYFTTSGLTNTWNFMAFTDFQNPNNTLSHQIISKMYAKGNKPALGICSGDLTGCGGYNDDWDWLINNSVWNGFTFATSPGDHEYWAQDISPVVYFDTPYCFNAIFNNPKNGSSEANTINTNYYFYYNNVLFVFLDMDDSNHSTYNDREKKQVDWFDKTIAQLEGTYQYLVVAGHKSIYGSQTTDTSVRKYLTEPWRKVFDKYNVDIVFSGHDHMFSRTKQLYNGKVSTDELKGTYYLDMGSSGNKYRKPSDDLTNDGLHETVIDLLNAEIKVAMGAIIDVTDTEMTVSVYNTLDEKVDSFVVKAKREAKEYDFSGFEKEALGNEMVIDITNGSTGTGKLSFTSSDNIKYVQNIKIVNSKGQIVCNENINFNDNKGINLNNLSGLTYKVYATLLDGTVQTFDIKISVGELLNLKVINEDGELYIKFTKEVKDIANNTYKLYVDGEFARDISDDEIKNKKVMLDYNLIIGTHKFKIELYSDGEYQNSFEVSNTGYADLVVYNEDCVMKVGEEEILNFYFEDGSLVEISSSDESICKYEGGKIKALKDGFCSIEVKISGTDYKRVINISVEGAPKKAGCNSGLKVEGSLISKVMTYSVFALSFFVLGLGLAFRPNNNKKRKIGQ